jgi:hypothetical protein
VWLLGYRFYEATCLRTKLLPGFDDRERTDPMPRIMRRRNRQTVPTLATWQVICQSFIDDSATDQDLVWIERNVTNLASVTEWIDHRRHVLENDPEGDPPDVLAVLTHRTKGSDLWYELIENGFRKTVERAPADRHPQLMKAIAAIVYNPAELGDFERHVRLTNPPPTWIRQGHDVAMGRNTTR